MNGGGSYCTVDGALSFGLQVIRKKNIFVYCLIYILKRQCEVSLVAKLHVPILLILYAIHFCKSTQIYILMHLKKTVYLPNNIFVIGIICETTRRRHLGFIIKDCNISECSAHTISVCCSSTTALEYRTLPLTATTQTVNIKSMVPKKMLVQV